MIFLLFSSYMDSLTTHLSQNSTSGGDDDFSNAHLCWRKPEGGGGGGNRTDVDGDGDDDPRCEARRQIMLDSEESAAASQLAGMSDYQ